MSTPLELNDKAVRDRGCIGIGNPPVRARGMAEPSAPHLTPASLFETQSRLDALRLAVYNRILTAVHQKIKAASTLPSSPQMTSFDVPEWQPGCPSFDVKDCILYVVWNLRSSGFKVLYVSPNRLVISWKEQSYKYYQEESPIRQAMLATAEAAASPASVGPVSILKQPKKAASYKPPPAGVAGMLASAGSKQGKSGSTITFI